MNMPGGVASLVSQIGMPACELRMPSGLPKPSPVMIAALICARNARLHLSNNHASTLVEEILQQFSRRADNVAQRFRLDFKLAEAAANLLRRIVGKTGDLTGPRRDVPHLVVGQKFDRGAADTPHPVSPILRGLPSCRTWSRGVSEESDRTWPRANSWHGACSTAAAGRSGG